MRLSKSFILILALTLTLTVAFGLSASMATDDHGDMNGCPFINAASICKMSPFEHIAKWQSLLIAVAPNAISLLALLALSFLSRISPAPASEKAHFYESERVDYKLRDIISHFSNRLNLAFSRGILHSRIYSLAV